MQGALLKQILEVSNGAGLGSLAVAFYDYESEMQFSYQGDRFFHAASTMKVAVLLAVFKAAEEGALKLGDALHVRNRFESVAGGGIFRIDQSRDGDTEVYKRLGRSMPIAGLARVMITRSSNLATNILFDYLGLERVRQVLDEAGIDGIKIQRGVEDEAAFEQGLNNEVTADGLVRLFRLFCNVHYLDEKSRSGILEILLAQEYNSMIPARLPAGAKVAHKTGEISTICHDAGTVFLPERKPYVLAILTEARPAVENRHRTVAAISEIIYRTISGANGRAAS
jgi:beta-lactamase class A